MLLCKVLVSFLLVPTALTSRANIINPVASWDEKISHAIDESIINILTNCYKTIGNTNPEIVVAGRWPDTFIPTLWSRKLIPATLIDQPDDFFPAMKKWGIKKQKIFVLSVSSPQHFGRILMRLFEESFSHTGAFIVVLRTIARKYQCVDIDEYFLYSLMMNALDTKIICVDRVNLTLVITFTPFVPEAPAPWRTIQVLQYKSIDSTLTILARVYRPDDQFCVEWEFDKTKNVTGYVIAVESVILPENKHIGKGINSKGYLEINKHIFDTMYRSWNITPNILYSLNGQYLGDHYTASGAPVRPMMSTVPASMRLTPKSDARSASYSRAALVFATKFKGHKTQLEKILCVIDKSSRIGLGLVLLLTFVFFKFFAGQAVMPAFLNVVRIVCNTGILRLPSNTSVRVYVTAVLLFALTMQGIYQGDLASLLTHNVPVRNVDTFQDLAESGYMIYGYWQHKRLFTDPIFKNRFVQLEYEDCIDYVIDNSSVACVNTPHVLMDQAGTLKLHLSTEYIFERDEVFVISPLFLLRDKFDKLLQRMVDADIIRPLHLRVKQDTLDDFRFDEVVMSNEHHKVLNLDELAFAFGLLAIGLILALVAFIGEIVIYRFQTRIANTRVKILNLDAWRTV